MKKWIFISIGILLATLTAGAQISFYGEWCYSNGELIRKTWVSPKGARSESVDKKTGELFVTIIYLDTKKAYALFPAKKRGMLLEPEKMSANQMMGLNLQSNEQGHEEYLGVEEVDGRACKKYYKYSTHINELTGESETENVGYFWYYEPLIASNYSGCIGYKIGQYDRMEILRNIRMGPQPDHLFEIPKDYEIMEIPEGGLLEMITGKPREQNQQGFDNARDVLKQQAEDLKSINDDPNKSQEEKLKALFEMLGGQKKK